MLTRRALLSGAAPAAIAVGIAGCSTFPPVVVNNGINPAFVDQVIATLQSTCALGLPFIPTASTIAAVVASLFGAAALATVQLISGSVSAVATEICSAVPTTATAAASLRRRLLRSSLALPVYIGTTPHGVVVTGYQR